MINKNKKTDQPYDIEGNVFNWGKVFTKDLQQIIIPNNIKNIPLETRSKTSKYTIAAFTRHCTRSFSYCRRQEKDRVLSQKKQNYHFSKKPSII